METIKTELAGLRASIDRIFESPDMQQADCQLTQAILAINDSLDVLAERTGVAA